MLDVFRMLNMADSSCMRRRRATKPAMPMASNSAVTTTIAMAHAGNAESLLPEPSAGVGWGWSDRPALALALVAGSPVAGVCIGSLYLVAVDVVVVVVVVEVPKVVMVVVVVVVVVTDVEVVVVRHSPQPRREKRCVCSCHGLATDSFSLPRGSSNKVQSAVESSLLAADFLCH